MTQQLVLKETGFYLRDSNSCSEPSSPTRPSTSLAPQKATSQNHAQKFPMSLSVLKPAVQTGLHPLWNVHLWVSESPSSCSSSLFQIWGTFSASMQWFRETRAVLHWVTVGSREAHVPREWLLTSFREAEVCSSSPSQFGSKHLPQICAWLGVPHSSISSAAVFSRLAS